MTLADDLVYGLDRLAWARDVLGFEPTDLQARVLGSTAKQLILCCHRQFGKTFTTAARATHELLYGAAPFVVIISGGKRQADEAAAYIASNLLKFPSAVAGIRKRDERGWELANGARVLTLPSSAAGVRGYAGVTLLIIDEAALVDDAVAMAVSPVTAVGHGAQIVMSTPAGLGGWFADHWRRRRVLGYDWIFAPWSEAGSPYVTRSYVEQERRKWGDWWYRQEFGCEFADPDEGVITRAQITAARRPGVEVISI